MGASESSFDLTHPRVTQQRPSRLAGVWDGPADGGGGGGPVAAVAAASACGEAAGPRELVGDERAGPPGELRRRRGGRQARLSRAGRAAGQVRSTLCDELCLDETLAGYYEW